MLGVSLAVVETPQFLRQAKEIWSEAERQEFVDFIACNPEVGNVIPETAGVRKVGWRTSRTASSARPEDEAMGLKSTGSAVI